MPKVISRAAVSSSTTAKPTASSVAALRTYYCICGEYQLVIDRDLFALPRRQTDEAIIIRSEDTKSAKARIFKLNAELGEPILLQRGDKYERQWRYHCTRCTLPIAYQTTPPSSAKTSFIYIIRGSLTQHQGEVPNEAFIGENS
ncbi:hypothetical protein M422DRAFT_57320 [Sphaerobolus stellatus SS14]|nr:hypothetical protein M422DRAFT_57320 [Sphaerobolus stellatus SS14]